MYKYEMVQLDYLLPIRIVTLDYPRLRTEKRVNEKHKHDQIEVILTLEGKMITYINDRKFYVQEGDIIVVNSNDIHYSELLKNTDVYKGYCIQIDYKFYKKYYQKLDDIVFNNYLDNSVNQEISQIVLNIVKANEIMSSYSYIYIEGQLLQLFYYMLLNSNEKNQDKQNVKDKLYKKRIREMLNYIHDNYNKDINAKCISQKFGISEGHLVKLFKEQIGLTPRDYINLYRLDKSVDSLLKSDDSILDIALNHGFTNIKSYYILFKNKYNMTPKEYRKINS